MNLITTESMQTVMAFQKIAIHEKQVNEMISYRLRR